MSRIFYRKKFSDYLGEQRAIDDIVTFYEPNPIQPTPSPTPGNVTPTPTTTPTPTPTPGRFTFYGITGTSEFDVCTSTSYGTIYQASQMPAIGQPLYYDSNLSNQITDIFWFISGGTRFYNAGFPGGPWSLQISSPCPTPTPTPTITPTNTATPTPTLTTTPTITPTLTQTPTPSPGPAFDPDATTYINAVIAAGGTLTAPQQTAINTFYVGLKADGIYNKFYYLHLFLGGTAGSNAINAKTPGTYDLSFQGTWTHSVTGSTTVQNNANYAESGFLISSASPSTTQTDFSFGYMLSNRNSALTPYQYMGIGTGADYMIIGNHWTTTANGLENFYSQIQSDFNPTGKSGVWNSISRTAVNSYFTAGLFDGASISGGLLNTATNTDVFTPSANVYDLNLFRVNGLNQFTLGGNALLNYASTSLSSAQLNSFATRANTLQIAFARNIFTP